MQIQMIFARLASHLIRYEYGISAEAAPLIGSQIRYILSRGMSDRGCYSDRFSSA